MRVLGALRREGGGGRCPHGAWHCAVADTLILWQAARAVDNRHLRGEWEVEITEEN